MAVIAQYPHIEVTAPPPGADQAQLLIRAVATALRTSGAGEKAARNYTFGAEAFSGYGAVLQFSRGWVSFTAPGDVAARAADMAACIATALDIAAAYTWHDRGARARQWVIDQMVRALAGCQEETRHGPVRSYQVQIESDAYASFVRRAGNWDKGLAP